MVPPAAERVLVWRPSGSHLKPHTAWEVGEPRTPRLTRRLVRLHFSTNTSRDNSTNDKARIQPVRLSSETPVAFKNDRFDVKVIIKRSIRPSVNLPTRSQHSQTRSLIIRSTICRASVSIRLPVASMKTKTTFTPVQPSAILLDIRARSEVTDGVPCPPVAPPSPCYVSIRTAGLSSCGSVELTGDTWPLKEPGLGHAQGPASDVLGLPSL